MEPDEFLKHNGDDGIKITHIGYLPEVFQNDTTAWMKMSITLDAIGNEDEDPGKATRNTENVALGPHTYSREKSSR